MKINDLLKYAKSKYEIVTSCDWLQYFKIVDNKYSFIKYISYELIDNKEVNYIHYFTDIIFSQIQTNSTGEGYCKYEEKYVEELITKLEADIITDNISDWEEWIYVFKFPIKDCYLLNLNINIDVIGNWNNDGFSETKIEYLYLGISEKENYKTTIFLAINHYKKLLDYDSTQIKYVS